MAEPLADAAIDRLVERGLSDIVSVPLVLLAAGHLKNDGPATLARARQRHPGVRFRMGRDLGIDPVVLAVVEDRIRAAIGEDDPAEVGVVLVGRGSSDPDACGDLFKFGRLLADGRGLGTVEPAFVSVAQPDVPGALERCRRLGARTVVVAPLLLFTGVLVPRIYRQAQDWAAEHPEVDVRGAAHLGPDPRLARLVLERHREAVFGDVRMNCDLCTYRVRLPSYEDKVGMPISLTAHGDAPARGKRRTRRATRAPLAPIELAPRRPGLRPAPAVEVPAGTPPALDVRGLRFAYPDGSPALAGVDLQVAVGRARRRARPQRRRQDDARAPAQRHARGRRGDDRRRRPGARRAHARRGAPPRGDRLPGLRRPALHAQRPRRRRLRPGQPGPARRRTARARRRGAGRASGSRTRPTARRISCRPASAAAPRWPACWPWSPTC